jgi:hypothetical protein
MFDTPCLRLPGLEKTKLKKRDVQYVMHVEACVLGCARHVLLSSA